MNTKYENKLSMYLAVKKVVDDNPTIVALIPNFDTYFQLFLAEIAAIITEKGKQSQDITGFTLAKQTKRKEVEAMILDLSKRIVAFAAVNGNQQLEQAVNFTKNAVQHTPDTAMQDIVTVLHTEGTAHMFELTQYGVIQQTLDDINTAISQFNAMLVDPRNAIAERKVATSNIAAHFATADNILKTKMDKLVALVSGTQPDFYHLYLNARIIIDLGHHEISLEGRILDSATLVPVRGVKVVIVETGNSVITAANGHYQFKSLQGGNYTLAISMKNYKPQFIQNIPVIEGKDYYRDISLERGDDNFNILPNDDLIVWHGTPQTNLFAIVKNTSSQLTDLWTYITVNPSDPIPINKFIIHPAQEHQFNFAAYIEFPTVYLHIKNPDSLNTARYQLNLLSTLL